VTPKNPEVAVIRQLIGRKVTFHCMVNHQHRAQIPRAGPLVICVVGFLHFIFTTLSNQQRKGNGKHECDTGQHIK
jgi:hypothetical protein